jgi:transposase-like protein
LARVLPGVILRGSFRSREALVQSDRDLEGAAIMTQMFKVTPTSELFKGRQFDQEIIVLCVRWYLSYKLSFRDLVEMMSERGITLAHTTILRWVQRYVPEFEKSRNRYARAVGGSWRCDETYIKVKGRWTYLYRAVDKQGRTVDFLLSEKRDVAAAKRFCSKALKNNGAPRVITLDAYAASHRAVAEMKPVRTMPRRVGLRSSKYLNNMIEQDHRRIKPRIGPMLGFKRFDTAAVTISGIELAAKIRKHQFQIGKLAGRPKTAPEIWAAVLAA